MRANHQKSHVIILIFDDLLACKFSYTTTSSPFPYTSRCSKMCKVFIFGHLTNRMVFTRLLSEGWLLLLIITPLALAIDFNIAHAELTAWYNGTTLEWNRLLICAGISFALMALMIAIGIGIPAQKAMKIDPAEALHGE